VKGGEKKEEKREREREEKRQERYMDIFMKIRRNNTIFYLKNSKDNRDIFFEKLSYLQQCFIWIFSCLFKLLLFLHKLLKVSFRD
jgi:hypothetical protein